MNKKTKIPFLAAVLVLVWSHSVFSQVKKSLIPVPNERQLAWQEAELGVLFSYDLHVFDGKKYLQRHNRINPVRDYQIFDPKHLDTDQWIRAAKTAGARFAILTATHETGFALYQSDANPYCLKAVKWRGGKGDIVKDFVESCRKYGVEPGIYVGIRWNSFFGVHNFQVIGDGEFREMRQAYYRKMCEGMVTELCTRYGELFEIWFDGGADHPDNGAPDVLPIVKKYQPNCLFYHNLQLAEARWGGSESGTVPYLCWATFPNPISHGGDTQTERIQLLKHGDPNGKYWMPAMSDAPLRGHNGRHEWFWEPGDEAHIEPLKDLMEMYYKSVGRNSTLIIGLTPDPNGLLPEPDALRLEEWGKEIERRFSRPLATASGEGKKLEIQLPKLQAVNHIVIQENIKEGERVRNYSVQIYQNGKWATVCEGLCIGHKRIQRFEAVLTNKIRLVIQEATASPQIKKFSVYFVEDR
jgi:alpha-L-fucosidase